MALNANILRASFDLVITREPDLTLRFYDNLFQMFPALEPLFTRTPRKNQARMLAEALVAVLDHLDDASWLSSTLQSMGSKHVEYGVTEDMYGMVGAALLRTIADVAREEWTQTVADQWTAAYDAISGLMLQGAAKRATTAAAIA